MKEVESWEEGKEEIEIKNEGNKVRRRTEVKEIDERNEKKEIKKKLKKKLMKKVERLEGRKIEGNKEDNETR